MAKTSPTQRSLAHYKKLGWRVAIVEHFNHYTKTRHDLFGLWDLLVLAPHGIVGVQVTTGDHVANRLEKAHTIAAEALADWRAAGGLCEWHGWSRRGPRGKRKVWTLRCVGVDGKELPA